MIRTVRVLLFLSIPLFGACASEKAYVPEQSATATLGGRTAAAYALPSEQNHQGDLRVASYGISDIERAGQKVKAVHLRLAVSGSGSHPLVLDVREQRLQLPDGRHLASAYASSAGKAIAPRLTIPPGSSRTVDLYFPLPRDLLDEDDPPSFDVVWRIHVGDQVISRVTPFDQVEVDPAVARQRAAEELLYYPRGYWYDPAWGPALIGTPTWYW